MSKGAAHAAPFLSDESRSRITTHAFPEWRPRNRRRPGLLRPADAAARARRLRRAARRAVVRRRPRQPRPAVARRRVRFVKGLGDRAGHRARQPRSRAAGRRRGHQASRIAATPSTSCSPRPTATSCSHWLRHQKMMHAGERLRDGARRAAAAVERRAGARARARGGSRAAGPGLPRVPASTCTATSPRAGATISPATTGCASSSTP